MNILLKLSALSAAAVLCGCALHPLPENVQRYNTADIVRHIRCEARNAVELNAIELLLKDSSMEREPIASEEIALAERLKSHPEYFAKVTENDIPGAKAKSFYLKYINSAIAYNYTFDMTEENNNNAELDFGRMLTNNTISLKLTGKADLARETNRLFVVSDTFDKLLKLKADVCGDTPVGPNLPYPISGEIGLKETVGTFIRLNQDDVLKGKKDDYGEEVLYSDQLKFTTTYGGSVTPMVMINPGSTFRLTQALGTSEVIRTDANQVIIGLSLGTENDTKSTKKTKRAAARVAPFGLGVISANEPVGAEARAINATVQNRYNTFLNNFGTIRLQ